MKTLALAFFGILMISLSKIEANEKDRFIQQRELDEACEVTREKKLAPLRRQFVDECVEKWKKDRTYCTRFYSDYGARTGDRAPLFHDTPECVKAFEYRKSYRQGK